MQQLRLFILGLFYRGNTALLKNRAGGAEAGIQRRVTGDGGHVAALLLRRKDGRDMGGALYAAEHSHHLVACLVIKALAVKEVSCQRITRDIGGSCRRIARDTQQHLSDHLFLCHLGHIRGGLLIILGKNPAVVCSGRGFGRRLGRRLGDGLLRLGGHGGGTRLLQIIVQRVTEGARADQQQDHGNNHEFFHTISSSGVSDRPFARSETQYISSHVIV